MCRGRTTCVEAVILIGVTPLERTFPLLVIRSVTNPLALVPLISAAGSVVVSVSDSATKGAASVNWPALAA